MNKIEKTIGQVIIYAAIGFGLIYVFLSLTGKAILTEEIERLTHRKTTIAYFNLSPALNLQIKDLKIEGLAKIGSVSLTTNIPSLFIGRVIFNDIRIVSPEFTFTRAPEPVVNAGKSSVDVILPSSDVAAAKSPPRQIKLMPLGFRRIRVEDGIINYIDQGISADGIKIVLKDVSCKVNSFYFYPRPIATSFELKGNIPWREGQDVGKVSLEGWINLIKRDMQATLKIQDIDAIYLYPYYSNWMDLEKARIERAKLNFTVDMIGLNNNVSAECHLELTDLVRKPLEPGQSEKKESRITNKVLDIFKTVDEGKMDLAFTFKTRMDSPEFGLGAFRMAFEEKIHKGMGVFSPKPENVLAMPLKVMEGGVRGITDLTRAMIDGVFAIGGAVVKAGKEQ